jgi:hypothetical protein
MRVEVLYVAECPFHPAAVKLVRDVLNSEGVAAEIREVLVRDDSMATDLRSLALQRSASTGGTLRESLFMERRLV